MTKHTPATPLPWRMHQTKYHLQLLGADVRGRIIAATGRVGDGRSTNDLSYSAHAANAYPLLVEKVQLLKWAVEKMERERGSMIGTYVADTNALLRELGEE